MDKKHNNVTEKLQKLVNKRKTTLVVIKAGSIRNVTRTSSSSFEGEYYPSYNEN